MVDGLGSYAIEAELIIREFAVGMHDAAGQHLGAGLFHFHKGKLQGLVFVRANADITRINRIREGERNHARTVNGLDFILAIGNLRAVCRAEDFAAPGMKDVDFAAVVLIVDKADSVGLGA